MNGGIITERVSTVVLEIFDYMCKERMRLTERERERERERETGESEREGIPERFS